MPAVPKFASPPRCRSQARKEGTSRAGTPGCTATTKGWRVSSATGVKSRTGLKGKLG
jgi:hypothetical protein